MAENYLDPDSETPPVARDTQSTDNSKSGVRQAWDQWTSKPENNAALLQFGIAMMQPRAQGQSSVGQFGNALGEAGEASTRNVTAQNLEKDREAQREERSSTAGYRDAQAKAALKNADAYGRQVDNMGGGGTGLARTTLSNQFRTQQAFRTWLAKPEDTTGMTLDPLLGAIQKEFPNIKTKADLASNPIAAKKAFEIYTRQFSAEPPDASGSADPATAAPPAAAQPPASGVAAPVPPPSAPQTQIFYDKKTGAPRTFEWDGTKWMPQQP